MKKALLVIDMQNVCVGEKHATYFNYDNEILIQAVNEVIDANESNMVIYIKNVMKKNLINKFAPFQAYEGTEEAELVSNLHIASNYVFTKYEGNAFSNPKLNDFLKEHNIECVVYGKGDKECKAYFDAKTKIHLMIYVESRTDNNSELFVSLNKPHNRLTESGVELRLKEMGKKLGAENNVKLSHRKYIS